MLVPDDDPEKLDPPMVPVAVILPSAVQLAAPVPELVRAKVVLEVSTKSKVYVPAAVWEILVSLAAMINVLDPESRVRSLVVEAMVKAPESVMV